MTVPHIPFPHRKKQACSLTQGKKMHFLVFKKNVFYMIESFKISVMFTGLQTCHTQAWKPARQKPRSVRWTVLCLQWLCWAVGSLDEQSRELPMCRLMGKARYARCICPPWQPANTLLHHPNSICENALFPLSLLRFYKSFCYFLPNGALHQFQVLVEGGQRKHKIQRNPNNSQNFSVRKNKGDCRTTYSP